LWEIPKGRIAAGTVWHTLGYPLGYNLYGGGWIYAMSDELLSLGVASALNARDPRNDPHRHLQDFKTHPFISAMLKDGKMVKYGAKTISEGGYWAMPQIYADRLMLVGESAGFLNSMRLKGIHLALKSGMMAAETAFEALSKEDYSAVVLKGYDERFHRSWAARELYRVRNFHQAYEKCLFNGMFHTGLQMMTAGRGVKNRYHAEADHKRYRKLTEEPDLRRPIARKFDGVLTFDKLTDVFASGTKHEEHQPSHLKVLDLDICSGRCAVEYGNPCQHFCPAQVYEMVKTEDGKKKLQLSPSNCVHCKTCDIADPYENITWAPPEGGGGPKYGGM
ncbi:MAG: electron transfer flavoprotein-ubiquinone oxidoreductase, partial [Calditrichaeota bacterium]|nr:electron transfer flavoprotein-ubiquinone oxidoreductase [Calditrichota bacterium]